MKGNITIHLPEEGKTWTVCYKKLEEEEYERTVQFRGESVGQLTELESGLYEIQVQGNEEYAFDPSVVSVPLWNEEEKEMQYDINIIPKYTHYIREQEYAPMTGDVGNGWIYGLFGMISLIIIVIISCHNRFKCGKMSNMYTKRRRT